MKREPSSDDSPLPCALAARRCSPALPPSPPRLRRCGGASAPARSRPRATAPPAPREDGVRWQALTPAQREALAPLERDWPAIDAPRKQKWIALAARFKTLPPEERARINERMIEWAKPHARRARPGAAALRGSPQVPAPDRSARWQAYQALPPEQRQQFAARAASAASGTRDAGAEAAPRPARDSKEAKSNVVPNPALAQPPRPVAPTVVQAAPGRDDDA